MIQKRKKLEAVWFDWSGEPWTGIPRKEHGSRSQRQKPNIWLTELDLNLGFLHSWVNGQALRPGSMAPSCFNSSCFIASRVKSSKLCSCLVSFSACQPPPASVSVHSKGPKAPLEPLKVFLESPQAVRGLGKKWCPNSQPRKESMGPRLSYGWDKRPPTLQVAGFCERLK